MFLKRIEMQGFKSFVDKTIISFNDPVTGIVGPNGCGKSNIADAIRWVLGEQSVKSMRGEKMTDVIFAGSQSRKAVNMAEVTLVFDNSAHILNSDKEEIEITRRIYNAGQEAEYLINHNQVRLKDINDLILDTGLGKDSLSMISQGNIVSFAEAKPYDRRAIFEDAAGVSKYKKRKAESLARLERTRENLERTRDVLDELERQVSPLKKAARKAEIYREKKARLEEIEVAVLVDEINRYKGKLEEVNKTIFDIESSLAMHHTALQVQENDNAEAKALQRELDKQINQLSNNLLNCVNEIQQLENRKTEIEEKRKYELNVAASEERIKEMRTLLENARFEYEDRLTRLNQLNAQLENLNVNLEEIAIRIADYSLSKEEVFGKLSRLDNRIAVLENLIKDPFSSQAQSGVKAIVSNRQSLSGIMGVVGQDLKACEGYDYAIAAALAASVYHIITKDEASARNAINFLKKNQSGRATFLPLNIMVEHGLRSEDMIVCEHTAGFLGTANEFINCEAEFDIVADFLLGNVIVCETLDSADELAALLNYNYKVVSLDGDIVHKGGSLTGGKVKNETSIITAASQLDKALKDRQSLKAQHELAVKNFNIALAQKSKLENELTEKRIAIAKIEPLVDVKRAKYEKMQAEFEQLSPDENPAGDRFSDEVVKKLAEAYGKKDEITVSLKLKNDERLRLSSEIDRREAQIRSLRRLADEDNRNLMKMTGEKASAQTNLENNLSRLSSEYRLTFEYAAENNNYQLTGLEKEEVVTLRSEIAALGNINMSAPEEYNEVNERYEFTKKNYDDLVASRNRILDAITQMDEVMKNQFLDTFKKINDELPNTFRSLFGGGKAKLVLEDETDILNTGIDIDVQPPGKSVKSIRLFSGGEKTLIAMCVLFTILKIKPTPLIVFDEVEAALDQANVERVAKYIKSFSNVSQFVIITHRPGTMAECETLYGVTMQNRGISQLLKVKLLDAIDMAEKSEGSV